jgi:hypothetical protein
LAIKFPLTVSVDPEGIVVFADSVAPAALIPLTNNISGSN